MKNYEDIISELYALSPSFQSAGGRAYHPGMQTMRDFDELMGHPHRKFKILHVAGTNGKGSVSSMLASALAGIGYRVGLYTSPHLSDFRERVKILLPDEEKVQSQQLSQSQIGMQSLMGSIATVGADPLVLSAVMNSASVGKATAQISDTVKIAPAQMIPQEDVVEFWDKYAAFISERRPSFFEITTALAFYEFEKMQVDFAVVEVGLGGRLDSTNIVTPIMSVITSIGLDHCDLLGDTLEKIAQEKAGIIKEEVPVVIGYMDASAENEIMQVAMEKNAEVILARDWNDLYLDVTGFDFDRMDLKGDCQKLNVRIVLSCLFELYKENIIKVGTTSAFFSGKLSVADFISFITPYIYAAAQLTALRGRWERLSDQPEVYADIAHNPQGVEMAMTQLQRTTEQKGVSWSEPSENGPSLYLVFGVVADKDLQSIMKFLPKGAYYFWTNAQGTRALPASELTRVMSESGFHGETCASVKEAVEKCLSKANKLDIIYIGGSSFVVSESLESFC